LTDESLLLGISVKEWDAAFTSRFEKNLKRGNAIMRDRETLNARDPDAIKDASSGG
jgi:hypothetical protein